MSLLNQILLVSFLEALVALGAGIAVIVYAAKINRLLHWVISFAVGAILGATFFDILPEAFEMMDPKSALFWMLFGFVMFFVLEKFLFWYHCHEGECSIHAMSYLILVGDGIHNFIDGVIITLAFLVDPSLGFTAAIAVILHEIPQEVSDFTIILHGGMQRARALFWNFVVALTVVVGALLTYMAANSIEFVIGPLLALVAGHFLYIAASDLIPELHHTHGKASSIAQIFLLIGGITIIYLI